jgi:hypothetical protein
MTRYVIYLDNEDFEVIEDVTIFDILGEAIHVEEASEVVLDDQTFEAAIVEYINDKLIDDMSVVTDKYIFVKVDTEEKFLEIGLYSMELKEKEVMDIEIEQILHKA